MSTCGGSSPTFPTFNLPFPPPQSSLWRAHHAKAPGLAHPPPPPPSHASFPSVGCNGAPGQSLFHCSGSGPRRGGQLPSPLAGCVQAGTPTSAVGNPSPAVAVGPWDVHLRGQFPNLPHLQPALSPAQSSLWRAHHAKAPPPPLVQWSVGYARMPGTSDRVQRQSSLPETAAGTRAGRPVRYCGRELHIAPNQRVRWRRQGVPRPGILSGWR